MKKQIVQFATPVTLVGGGALGVDDLETALALAPDLIAADGGAGPALAAGYMPEAVIGDFDSLRRADRDRIPPDRLFPIREQDSTDFDKAIRSISAPLVLAVGFLGARVDHQLAAFNVLVRYPERPCVLLGAREVVFHAPPALALDLTPGAIVSLFPMRAVTGRSQGLEWPIDGVDLAPDRRVGTSNRALGEVRIETDGPGLLVIVPRDALEGVMRVLAPGAFPPAPASGPAPARA
ncbi:thiamine diphosphokinase [Antarcticimicrobium luteum]|uniref:Thiamine diphosphokinase n=1 Tax=Antarcticimicrobium luteum TaxID=2547397 RepID=A0A4R5UV95_9RHOB|nr:thiamine diphosphokinase [Antarcticimicrobium luteum]TDK43122.1 thiamine diphosphokinase [Antarcticimicrobium luteum]